MKNFAFFGIIFLISCNFCSGALITGLLNSIEELFVGNIFFNCTTAKKWTSSDIDNMRKDAKPHVDKIKLTHYTRTTQMDYLLNNASAGVLASPSYNKNLPMVIFIYGYLGNVFPFNGDNNKMVSALRNVGKFNFFMLNNLPLMMRDYYRSSTYAIFTGEALGLELVKFYAGGVRDIHLIGHSLGAQASGFAGKIFQQKVGKNIRRISGLDPAGPCFYYEPPTGRLVSTDADFVDVIHTNTKTFGSAIPSGHVDFYPNGGEVMEGCLDGICSHVRAIRYYAESVSNNQFLSLNCANWNVFNGGACVANKKAYMGYWTPENTTGIYYLKTNHFSKYAKGAKGIKTGWQFPFF